MINSKEYDEINEVLQELPSPISSENPLFTNPQFLAKINEDIKKFSLQRKNSYASTSVSRQNSHLNIYGESHQNQEKNNKIVV